MMRQRDGIYFPKRLIYEKELISPKNKNPHLYSPIEANNRLVRVHPIHLNKFKITIVEKTKMMISEEKTFIFENSESLKASPKNAIKPVMM